MSLFDLLFLGLFFAAAATVLAAGWLALRRQFGRAGRVLRALAVCACAYMAVVIGVSLGSPRRVLTADAPQCFDDWCIAVAGVRRAADGGVTRYSVDLRLSSRARRAAQRENNLRVYLTDNDHTRYDPIAGSDAIPFNILLQPGESVTVSCSFAVPAGAKGIGLVITHEGGFPIGWFIIGYDTWFRKPPVLPLE